MDVVCLALVANTIIRNKYVGHDNMALQHDEEAAYKILEVSLQ